MSEPSSSPKLEYWLQQLGHAELPALSGTVRKMMQLTEKQQSSAQQLAQVILPDAGVTAKLLKVANSVHFNPTAVPINTISRAIVMLGFNELRRIGLSVVFIDSLLQKNANHILKQRLAESLHAAVQAKNLAFDLDDEDREEVFIATLFQHLGELSFLSSSTVECKRYLENLHAKPQDSRSLGREVLGIGFSELTQGLATDWHLQHLLTPVNREAEEAVQLGDRLAQTWDEGVDSRPMRQLITSVAAYTGLSLPRSKDLVEASAREAAKLAQQYELESLHEFLPDANANPALVEGDQDSFHQMNYLHKISVLVRENASLHRVFQLITDAIHYAVGFGRVIVVMHDQDKHNFEVRYCLGDSLERLRVKGKIPIKTQQDDILSRVIKERSCELIKRQSSSEDRGRLRVFSPEDDCCCGPIEIEDELVGVIYADNRDQPISDENYQAFQLFVEQLNMICACLVYRRLQGSLPKLQRGQHN
ncbi:hypothetical protein R50073_14770 [Maricurvus nonylphenolicus]